MSNLETAVSVEDRCAYLVEENCDWFRDLVADAKSHISSPTDLFALCLHAFMVELGFVPELDRKQIVTFGWHKPSAGYFINYQLPVRNTENASVRVRLSVFRLGEHVTKVHGLTLAEEKASFFTTKLRPEEFVVEDPSVDRKNWSLKNVGSLARLFKSEVGWPLLQTSRRLAGIQTGGLLSLPTEIELLIVSDLGKLRYLCTGGKKGGPLNCVYYHKILWLDDRILSLFGIRIIFMRIWIQLFW
jgi:hypothetical protein